MKKNITYLDNNEKEFNSKIDYFFKNFQFIKIFYKSNFIKQKGFKIIDILKYLFMLIFTGKNHYRTFSNKDRSILPKDTVYNFLNNSSFNWRKLLFEISYLVILKINTLTSDDRVSVLIVDDTTYSRNRSKNLEMLGYVHDHSSKSHKSIKGFKAVSLSWFDGFSQVPVDFTMNTSNNEKYKINGINKKIDLRTNGGKRRKEAYNTKIKNTIDMLERAITKGIPAKYILFDSWYAYPTVIREILSKTNTNVICRIKNSPTIRYEYGKKRLSVKQLYKKLPYYKVRGKSINSIIIGIGKDEKDKLIKAKIVFVRNTKSKDKKWIAILSTDITIKNDEIIRIYTKRWNIEVLFKISKSYLKLEKEFSGRSYDMLIAHTTITFLRYIFLSLETRESKDPRTIGNMFYYLIDEIKDIATITALKMIFRLLEKALDDILQIDEEEIKKVLDYFIDLLPNYIKGSTLFCKVES